MASIKGIVRKVIYVRASVFEKARAANDKKLAAIKADTGACVAQTGAIARELSTTVADALAARDAHDSIDYAKLCASIASVNAQLAHVNRNIEALAERVGRIEEKLGTDTDTVFRF